MIYRRQAKIHSRRMARRLRDSLVWRNTLRGAIIRGDDWEIVPHDALDRITHLKRGDYELVIQPSKQLPAIRIFDRCSVQFRGADVWLPLIQRIRLKNAIRLWMATLAG